MPVDIDDTTKLSEEQRKFFSISTGSPSRRRRKPQQLSIYHIYPTNCANVSSATIERQAHTFQQMSQDSRREVRRKQQRASFSTVLFLLQVLVRPDLVHRDDAIFSMHAQHVHLAHDRDAAPDWRTTLSDSAAGRGTCSRSWVEVDREGARARYRCLQSCLQRVASRQSGVTSSPLLARKLDVNSRPEGSFFFICVFVIVACAIKKRVSQKKKKKKSPRMGGACATRATCELRAC